MARFDKVLQALIRGQSAQREQWDPIHRVFVSGNSLMWQGGRSRPWRCALSWDELAATDWKLVKYDSISQQVNEMLARDLPDLPGSERHISDLRYVTEARLNSSPFLLGKKR